jgi:hypothetical protein
MSTALNALKEFVRQPTGQNQAEDTVCLQVTHSNLKQRFIEIRVDLHVLFSTFLLIHPAHVDLWFKRIPAVAVFGLFPFCF